MPSRLRAIQFSKASIDRVSGFDCGNLPHQKPLSEWIKNSSITALQNKTRIWLYETDDSAHSLVGYGSLYKASFSANGQSGKVCSIPTLAVQKSFWRQPDNALNKEDRFSVQIVRHLQKEAKEMVERSPTLKPILMLYVHTENAIAKRLYEYCGFVPFDLTIADPASGGKGQAMIYDLVPVLPSR
jgi:hypothetical protein